MKDEFASDFAPEEYLLDDEESDTESEGETDDESEEPEGDDETM